MRQRLRMRFDLDLLVAHLEDVELILVTFCLLWPLLNDQPISWIKIEFSLIELFN